MDWCRRFRDAGWRVVYLPAAQVIHHEGKSSEQVVAARHIHFQTSKVRYFGKYHGRLAEETLRLFFSWAITSGNWGWKGPSGCWATNGPCAPNGSPLIGRCCVVD